MKFIKPSEISGKIMSLIDESDKFVLMVSPYIRIAKWYKLLNTLEKLAKRNVPFTFIIRENDADSIKELTSLGFQYSSIKNLHSKLYLNEKYAIVSSMNLLLSSEINSLEIAYMTESQDEYDELVEYCKRHLHVDFDSIYQRSESNFRGDWRDYVFQILSEKLNARVRMQGDQRNLNINTGVNNYNAFIWGTKEKFLRISGILAYKEYEVLKENPGQIKRIPGMNIDLVEGGNGYYDTIAATSAISLNSTNINDIEENEKDFVAETIIKFVFALDEFKVLFREIQRSIK